MASLAGNAINASCAGLIKTTDNGVVGATEKQITDGLGNSIPMTMGTGGVSFTGGADFTGATVTGLPTGSAGLVSGTGTDSMKNADSLVTTPADAAGAASIAIGENAKACGTGTVAIGCDAIAPDDGVAIGRSSGGTYGTVAIGDCARTNLKFDSIAIGKNVSMSGVGQAGSIAIGCGITATSGNATITIGKAAVTGGSNAVAIGSGASSCAISAVALGAGVAAAKDDTVTVKELETCVAGGGIYLTTPDGTAQPKLTVNNSSELLIGGNPIGAAGLESGTGADSMQSAASLTTTAANASGTDSIALGDGAVAGATDGISIGRGAGNTGGTYNIAIGGGADAGSFFEGAVAIGYNADASYTGISIGCGATGFQHGIVLGKNAVSTASYSILMGRDTCSTQQDGIVIGRTGCANAVEAVAIGRGVTAAKACTVTVKELETCVAGGGITLKSADLTEEKMTLTDADVLAVGGDTIPANDSATPTVVNRIWSGSQAQYDALGTYDANTLYYIA